MKKIGLIAVSLYSFLNGNAQIADQEGAKQSAFAAAKAMDEALIQRRYDDYVSYNHPRVLESIEGGKAGMVKQVANQMAQINESGNIITAVWPQMPSVVIDTAGEWQAAITQYMAYRLPEGKIKATTTIIGISQDQGKQWYFIDAAGRELKQMRELFPTLSSKLKVPKATEPEFTPDEAHQKKMDAMQKK